MHTPFHVHSEKDETVLRIQAEGAFDGAAAVRLHDELLTQYNGQERVVIDAGGLTGIHAEVGDAFRTRLQECAIPNARLFFKGKHGSFLAPEGSHVLQSKATSAQTGCCGQCTHCSCRNHPGTHAHGTR